MKQSQALSFFISLLRLYPKGFQARFSQEMAGVFSQAYQETAARRDGKLFHFAACEFAGVIHGAMIAHWEAITGKTKGGSMKPSFSEYWDQQPTNFWGSILASVPYLLFTLAHTLPILLMRNYSQALQSSLDQLYQIARDNPVTWWALTQVSRPDYWSGSRVFYQFSDWAFGIFIFIGLLFAWRAHWPQWSTTFVGFALLNLALLIINIYPDGIMIGIVFLICFAFVVSWTARRSLFHALLTALPFACMFGWLINMDSIIGWEIENYLFLASGLAMTFALFVGLRAGNPAFTFGVLTVVCGAISGANAYYTTYYSNMRFPPEPTLLLVGQGTLFGMFFILIFTAPVWIGTAVRWFQVRKT